MTMPRRTQDWRRTGSTERPMTAGWRKALQMQGKWAPGSVWEQTEGEWLRGTVGLGRGKPARREPRWRPRGPYPRGWKQKVARWALWGTGGEPHLADLVSRDNGTAAQCGSSALEGVARPRRPGWKPWDLL